jgi:SAM-dependent methyltransferase
VSTLSTQRETNEQLWQRPDLVRRYTGRELRPVERRLLRDHHEDLTGRVLDVGAGAGRFTGYLDELAAEVTAIDVSPHMVAALHEAYPGVRAEQRDLRDLSDYGDASFDAVVAGYNIADILDHEERGALLDELHRILAPGGLLVLSGHNLGAEGRITEPLKPRRPKDVVALIIRGPRWWLNRRRLLPYEQRERDHAILNDVAHDFQGLHYYIGRDAQERQLDDHGFELLECLDLEGDPVPAGAAAPAATELHYVARRR